MAVILCFGDSNTHGTGPMAALGDRTRYDGATRWPGVMRQALGDGWEVIEEGHPGRTTVHEDPIEGEHKSGLRVLPSLLESHRPIDLVILMLGTNDLKARFAVTPMDIALSVERLARLVLASDAGPEGAAPRLLIVCPPPVVETGVLAGIFEGAEWKANALPAEYRAMAERVGAAFFDAGGAIAVDPLDGVHFSAEDHGVLGHAIAAAVREMGWT